MLKKLLSHSIIYGLAPFVPRLIGFLMLPIFTLVLTEVDFGVQSVINSGIGLIGVLSFLGLQLPISNAYFHHRHHYKRRWSQIYGFLNIWMIFYASLLAVIIYFITPEEAQDNVFWIIILNVVPIVCFGPTSTIGYMYFQLNQKPIQVAIRVVGAAFLTIVLNYYTIVVLNMHYMGWFLSNCISTLMLNFSYWYVLRYSIGIRPIYLFKKYVIKRSLKISLPMLPHYYSSYLLNSSDILLLKFFAVTTANIGIYGFAAGFGLITNMAVIAMNTAATPILSELIRKKDYLSVRNLTWAGQLFLFTIIPIGCLFLKEIFYFLVKNDNLAIAYPLASVFIMSHIYRPMYFGVSSFLFYSELTKNLWKVTFGAGLFCIIINLIVIPILGFKAPAYTLFFAYLILGYGTFLLKDYKKIEKVKFGAQYWVIANIGLLLLVLLLIDTALIVRVVFSLLILTGSIIIYKQLKLNLYLSQ